jgi:hypothetical protein
MKIHWQLGSLVRAKRRKRGEARRGVVVPYGYDLTPLDSTPLTDLLQLRQTLVHLPLELCPLGKLVLRRRPRQLCLVLQNLLSEGSLSGGIPREEESRVGRECLEGGSGQWFVQPRATSCASEPRRSVSSTPRSTPLHPAPPRSVRRAAQSHPPARPGSKSRAEPTYQLL